MLHCSLQNIYSSLSLISKLLLWPNLIIFTFRIQEARWMIKYTHDFHFIFPHILKVCMKRDQHWHTLNSVIPCFCLYLLSPLTLNLSPKSFSCLPSCLLLISSLHCSSSPPSSLSPHTSSHPPGTPTQRARHLPDELVGGWPPLYHHTSSLDRLFPAARWLDPRSGELQAVWLYLLHQYLRQHRLSLLYINRQVPGCGIPSALCQGSTNQNRYVG